MFAVGCVETPDLGGSDTAQAAIGPVTVTTEITAFATPVTVTFVGLDGAATDWIAIAPQGSPFATITRWASTGGATSGSKAFEGPAAGGTYVARAFDASSALLGESDPFTIAESPVFTTGIAKPSVTTDAPTYTSLIPLGVIWSGLPGGAKDWIGLAPSGSVATTVSTWVYASGAINGRTFFNTAALAPGSYVARAFANNSYTIITESAPFTVTAVVPSKVTTDLSTYTVDQSIVMSWAGLPGSTMDWIGYAPEGSPATTVTRWLYTGGAKSGSRLIEGALAPGTYVARTFVNNSYNKSGESTSFVVH